MLTGTKGVGSLGKGLHGDRNLHGLKSGIPQASPAFAKNSGEASNLKTVSCTIFIWCFDISCLFAAAGF